MADNLAALDVLDATPNGPWGPADRDQLGRWHGWGAAPQLFDRPEFEDLRAELHARLGDDGFDAARRTTLNAHYTDPRLVEALWATVEGLGVHGGTFLEPGCGAGGVMDAAPPGWHGLGIELDPSTARIAAARLGDRHQVETANFARVQVVAGAAAAVVGNVPFGRVQLHDPDHNPDRQLSIHNHFLAKSAATLAPGGVAAVITSRHTLDALDDSARQFIGGRADFVGAIRLPEVAHETFAGTRVVTDLVVLRGRNPGAPASHAPGFLDQPTVLNPGDRQARVRVSGYYAHHPDQVIGVLGERSGPYGPELAVTADRATWADALAPAVDRLVAAAPAAAPPVTGMDASQLRVSFESAAPSAPVGRIERRRSGTFERRVEHGWEPHVVAPAAAAELGALVGLRDGAAALVAAEADPLVPDAALSGQRMRLAGRYSAYVDRWGPINRCDVKANGARNPPRLGGFRHDPGWPRVAALELYDEGANVALPAALLERRLIVPTVAATSADSPAEAVAVSLQRTGLLDATVVAELLGAEVEDVPSALGDLAFTDPGTHQLVPAPEYLSGNVRAKLDVATAAAEADPDRWGRNVAALGEVVPRDVTADELTGLLGAPWVPRETITAYARHLAGVDADDDRIYVQHSTFDGRWAVRAPAAMRAPLRGDHELGTEHRDALMLLEDGLKGKTPVVMMKVDEASVVNPEATEAARETLGLMREHFDHWLLHDDAARSSDALGTYNRVLNSTVPRDYSGIPVKPPGLRQNFVLQAHQTAAVARMLHGGNTLLAHPVGAGKTAEMIAGATELRRTGAISRPCFVVPNHMLDQFSHDVADLFPAVEVLAVSSADLNKQGRAAFAAKVRSHDWGAVVLTHEAFKAWPLSAEVREQVDAAKVERIKAEIFTVAGQGDGRTIVKNLEKKLLAAEERVTAARAVIEGRHDDHDLPFDQAGIDYVVIDEAHVYKNAGISTAASNLRGIPGGDAAGIAEDLGDKLAWLRSAHPGRPVVTMATATPISNTVAEMWVFGRYLRPDLLADMGMEAFDDFRGQFCETTAVMELDPSGTKFKEVERLARYQNLPELARWWGEFADVVQVDDLGLARPDLADGRRQVLTVAPPPGLVRYMTVEVDARVEAIRSRRVAPTEDNMLKLSSDCRMASFDWEAFSGETVAPAESTLATCADQVADTYHATKDRPYRTPTGAQHPRPGALQVVFADLGTPAKGDDTKAYHRFRQMLGARGVPAEQVQFSHEHDANGASKERFFAACRDGRIAVAVSSTAKMGMGTNVQDRLVAMHHLDCPWRPSDIEQREGRIVRQGNQNPEVMITAYATEQSFSVYGWQTLERKAGFIGQVMRATPDGPRSVDVSDEEAMGYGEIKALATGDPDFLRQSQLESDLARLERLARAHGRDTISAGRRVTAGRQELAGIDQRLAAAGPVVAHLQGLDGDRPWSMTVHDGRRSPPEPNRADAARAIQALIAYRPRPALVACFDAEALDVRHEPLGGRAGRFQLVTPNGDSLGRLGSATVDDRTNLNEVLGAIRKLDNSISRLPERLEETTARRGRVVDQIDAAGRTAATPFSHQVELSQARREVIVLKETLAVRYAAVDDPAPAKVVPSPLARPSIFGRGTSRTAVFHPTTPASDRGLGR